MPVSVPASACRPGSRFRQGRQRTRFRLNVCCTISRTTRPCCNAPRHATTAAHPQPSRQGPRRNCNQSSQTRVLGVVCQCRRRVNLARLSTPCNGLRLNQFFPVSFSSSFLASSNVIPNWSSTLNFINRRNQRKIGWSEMTAAFSRNDQNSTPQQKAVK